MSEGARRTSILSYLKDFNKVCVQIEKFESKSHNTESSICFQRYSNIVVLVNDHFYRHNNNGLFNIFDLEKKGTLYAVCEKCFNKTGTCRSRKFSKIECSSDYFIPSPHPNNKCESVVLSIYNSDDEDTSENSDEENNKINYRYCKKEKMYPFTTNFNSERSSYNEGNKVSAVDDDDESNTIANSLLNNTDLIENTLNVSRTDKNGNGKPMMMGVNSKSPDNAKLDLPFSKNQNALENKVILHNVENVETLNPKFQKIIEFISAEHIILCISEVENKYANNDEDNYICIITNQTKSVFLLVGITINQKLEIFLGVMIDPSKVIDTQIDGNGSISLYLEYSHVFQLKVVNVRNFWKTLHFLKLISISYSRISQTMKSKNSDGLNSSNDFDDNENELFNYYIKKKSNDERILFLWYKNDVLTSIIDLGTLIKEDPNTKHLKLQISENIEKIFASNSADDVTLKFIMENLSDSIPNVDFKPFKNFIMNSVLFVYGKLKSASKILDNLYLGSEYNASDIQFLNKHKIKHILNATIEIDNFFFGLFNYFNIPIYDVPESNLLPHFDNCFKFIDKAICNDEAVLVHCQMGISRSASVVIAYIMKKSKVSLSDALNQVKKARNFIKPNEGFLKQLDIYEKLVCRKNIEKSVNSDN